MLDIFICAATKREIHSPTERRRAFLSFLSFPKAPPGMEAVYKPYGDCGAGFYYVKIQTLEEKWG